MGFMRAMARGRSDATPARVMLSVGTVVFAVVAIVVVAALLVWALA